MCVLSHRLLTIHTYADWRQNICLLDIYKTFHNSIWRTPTPDIYIGDTPNVKYSYYKDGRRASYFFWRYTWHYIFLLEIYLTLHKSIGGKPDVIYLYWRYTRHYIYLLEIYLTLHMSIRDIPDIIYVYWRYIWLYIFLLAIYRTLHFRILGPVAKYVHRRHICRRICRILNLISYV